MIKTEELQTLVPAAFADAPADHVSDKYQFVRTMDVIDTLGSEGWRPVQAYQQSVRKNADVRANTTKHVIVLKHENALVSNSELGGLTPIMRIINSHDHSSRFKVIQEILRKVCANGLQIAEGESANYNVRHDQIHEDIQTILSRFKSNANRMFETAVQWGQTQLDDDEWRRFATSAAQLRFGEEANEGHIEAIMRPRRGFDAGDDLFKAFNRAQENGMRGGVKAEGMKRKSRALTNIDAQLRFNEQLRDLARETYARLN